MPATSDIQHHSISLLCFTDKGHVTVSAVNRTNVNTASGTRSERFDGIFSDIQ